MPSTQLERKVDESYIAKDKIPADQFIPHYLDGDVIKKLKSEHGGGGTTVGVRGFNCSDYSHFSPFLTMSDITVARPLCFPDHPHYGHEMALYVLDGEFTHEDFGGWEQTFKVGDFHWMTTGKGIVHAQKPGPQPKNRHVQFWINLPKDKKQIEPQNQLLRANETPIWKDEATGVEGRVLVGRYAGKESSIKTVTPLLFMDVTFPKKDAKVWELSLPDDWFIGFYIIEGKGKIGEKPFETGSIVTSKATKTGKEMTCTIQSTDGGLRFLVFAGKPIEEAINFEGFFVGHEKCDTEKAFKDFTECTNGFAKGKTWRSKLTNK